MRVSKGKNKKERRRMRERIRGEIRAGEGQMERESRNKEMGVEEVQRKK
jgi:hypothetical protein